MRDLVLECIARSAGELPLCRYVDMYIHTSPAADTSAEGHACIITSKTKVNPTEKQLVTVEKSLTVDDVEM